VSRSPSLLEISLDSCMSLRFVFLPVRVLLLRSRWLCVGGQYGSGFRSSLYRLLVLFCHGSFLFNLFLARLHLWWLQNGEHVG
jgi:hypothetical protein